MLNTEAETKTGIPEMVQRSVTIPCSMCHNHCGVEVQLSGDRITGVKGWADHPLSQGRICIKCRQIPVHVYHDSRLKHPVRKVDGKWQQISWDEALDTIAEKLSEAKERYGADSLAVICGDPVENDTAVGASLAWRFCDVYGTPNRFHAGDTCFIPLLLAQAVTLGGVYEPDVENTNLIIVWGDDPQQTYPSMHNNIVNARKRGAKLIVIDPRRRPIAEQADIHIQPRPGTDGIIMLAMINVIISEGLYDREFVENWTSGFDKLALHAKKHTPEDAARISGVAAEDIVKIARMYASTKHACIHWGFKVAACACGFYNGRSMAILAAITGNIEVQGGEMKGFSFTTASLRLPELMGGRKHPTGDKYPLYPLFTREIVEGCMLNWGDLVLNEPRQIRNMIISGANPAVTWPNTPKVRKALEQLDFLVVMDGFMTDTAQLADIVLPACTFLEKMSILQWRGYALRMPVIAPLWECWPDSKFYIELARRLGYEKHFPWKNDEELINFYIEPTGLTVKKILQADPSGYIHTQTLPSEQQYRKEHFRTPSTKVELFSTILEQLGHEPLPIYIEPKESPISTPNLFKEYPLILTTGTKELEYYHSEQRQLEALRRRRPGPAAEVHPETAAKYGVTNGEMMRIETTTGSLDIKAEVVDKIMPGMVSVPHAWPEAPANMLTDDAPVDPVSGFAGFTGILCRISPT